MIEDFPELMFRIICILFFIVSAPIFVRFLLEFAGALKSNAVIKAIRRARKKRRIRERMRRWRL